MIVVSLALGISVYNSAGIISLFIYLQVAIKGDTSKEIMCGIYTLKTQDSNTLIPHYCDNHICDTISNSSSLHRYHCQEEKTFSKTSKTFEMTP